jgi:hypothetical protein
METHSLNISIVPDDLNFLKSKPLPIQTNGTLIEVVSATLVSPATSKCIEKGHNLALKLGKNIIGGWTDPFSDQETVAIKCTILENYKYLIEDKLSIVSDIDFKDLEITPIVYISYRVLY